MDSENQTSKVQKVRNFFLEGNGLVELFLDSFKIGDLIIFTSSQ